MPSAFLGLRVGSNKLTARFRQITIIVKSHEKHILEYNLSNITYNRLLYCIQNNRHFENDQKLSLLIDMKEFERLNQHFELMVNTPDLMWLGRNTNHFQTHPVVLNAMLNSIKDEDFHVYAPPFGLEGMSALITVFNRDCFLNERYLRVVCM